MEKLIEIPDYYLGEPFYRQGQLWTSMHNFQLEDKSKRPASIQIHDVTLRDGEQTPGVTFRADERYRIATALDELGVARIEAGMPIISQEVRDAISKMVKANMKAKIYSFTRAHPDDIKMSLDLGVDGIIIEHTINPVTNKQAYHLTAEAMVERLITSVNFAVENKCPDVVFMGWDWFRAPLEWSTYLIDNLVENTRLNGVVIVDTFSSTTPDAVGEMFRIFTNRYPQLRFEFHGHNDIGMANANGLAAAYNGAKVIHTAMNGLGERCGNAATEETAVVFQCHKGIDAGIHLEKIDATSKLVENISKIPVYPNKQIVGTRPYALESGVGTDVRLKLKNSSIAPVGAIVPSVIGRTDVEDVEFLLGKNSGKASIKLFLAKHGLEADNDEIKEILALVKEEGMVTKALVSDAQFLNIVRQVKARKEGEKK